MGLLSLCLLLIASVVSAQNDAAATDQQVSLLLKALSFERAFETRFGPGLHIAVVYRGEAATGAARIAEAFEREGKGGVKGLPVSAGTVAFESVAQLLARVEADALNVLYIDASLASALSSVQQVARARKITSIGATEEMVAQGSSLGVGLRGPAPQLVVNLRAWKVEGVDLDQAILKIAKVVD